MVNQTDPTPRSPYLRLDTVSIAARLSALADVQPCPDCGLSLWDTVADSADLLIEVARLYAALLETRLESANRLAAIRATLGAAQDGEPDPLDYLRDEVADSSGVQVPEQQRGWW
ncbi:MAG: hypothetical protein ACRDSP_10620 [Pseudonocardiaceae bacterium]